MSNIFSHDSYKTSHVQIAGYTIEYYDDDGTVEITGCMESKWHDKKWHWHSVHSEGMRTSRIWSIPCFGGELVKDKFNLFLNNFFMNPNFKKGNMEQLLRLHFNWEIPDLKFFDV